MFVLISTHKECVGVRGGGAEGNSERACGGETGGRGSREGWGERESNLICGS